MKHILALIAAATLALPVAARAQDAATEERLNQLSGKIQDLIEARDAQNKRIEELARQVRQLQEQQAQPGNFASQEDLKTLAAKLQEIDRKRQQDNDLIVQKIDGLKGTLSAAARPAPVKPSTPDHVPSTGYEYEVKPGDTLSAIVQAYRDQKINVTVEQIQKANPGLVPEKMKVGQKLFIPAP